jgi:hypothetical protein
MQSAAIFVPSPQQSAFMQEAWNGISSLVLIAVAGAGKTTTILKTVERMRGSSITGYTIDVFDGEDYSLKDSADVEAILGAMFSTDDDRLYLCKGGKSVGWVWLIYGNSGWDVISDHTISIEDVLRGAVKLSEEMEDNVDV